MPKADGSKSPATTTAPIYAATAAVAFGLLAVALLLAGARWLAPLNLTGPVGDAGWSSRTRAWFVGRGFQSAEVRQDTLEVFNWTGPTARFLMPNLNRSEATRLVVNVAAPRPDGVDQTAVRILVDGQERSRPTLSADRQDIAIDLPARPQSGAIVALETTVPFTHGPQDPRRLGFIVNTATLSAASGHLSPSVAVLVRAGLAVACVVMGLVLLCPGSTLRLVMASGVTAGFSWLLLLDGAFIGPYIDRLLAVSIAVGVVAALASGVRRHARTSLAIPEWPAALSIAAAVLAIKLALFGHPLANIGDGVFQVHRAQMVHGGQYFFTSVTPKPFFEFPYAIALYVTAMPFWAWFPTEVDKVFLLRSITLVVDGLVGVSLYAITRQQWRDGRLALAALLAWSFTRAPFIALANANLTNAFGQGMFGLAMAAVAWLAIGAPYAMAAAGTAGILLTIAFLSHFGTVSIGVPVVSVVIAVLFIGGRPDLRRAAVLTLALLIGAGGTAFVTYYSHFMPVYRQTIARVRSTEGDADPGKLVAPPATKLRNWLTERTDDYGIPGVPLATAATIGLWVAVRRRRSEGLTRVLGGWSLTWLAFSALGILSAIQMRANLSAAPFFSAFGALGLGTLVARRPVGVILAVIISLGICWDGLRLWFGLVGR